jgi:putative lipoprotein
MLLCGAVAEAASAQSIQGTATYRDRMSLPPGAVFVAVLEDVSRADAPAAVIATTQIPSPGPPPIPFTIAYDRTSIVESRRYVVRGRILVKDQLLFTSDTATPVITGGHPSTVSITLRRVGSQTPAGSRPPALPDGSAGGLQGTAWNAVELYGTPVTEQSAASDRRPHLVFGADGRVSGADGCNRLTGPYTVKANGITFGLIAATQMACPDTGELADRFRAALKGTSHWRIVKGQLEFYGATGKPLAVFERRPVAPGGAAALQGTWQLMQAAGADTSLSPDRVAGCNDTLEVSVDQTGFRCEARSLRVLCVRTIRPSGARADICSAARVCRWCRCRRLGPATSVRPIPVRNDVANIPAALHQLHHGFGDHVHHQYGGDS